ncbi:MAG: RNA polymerase sigma factor [Parvularculaceae bacterium]|nr:RNA polymerase sigma factor [Parvularculaceae bacterium]
MTFENVSDEELIASAGNGDRLAASELISRHADKIIGVCWRMLGERAAAEDVAQEAFLRLWEFAPKWNPDGGARIDTWLYRVAVNRCVDRLRKTKREAPQEAAPEMADDAPSATQVLIGEDRRKSVLAALETLPERQRLAVVLCHYQELSNIEAADVMKISVDALESLLARGRRALKTALAPMRQELMEGLAG